MATAVLNNGLFTRDVNYSLSSNFDEYHLLNMIGNIKPTDMGVVDIWATMQKVEMPLYQFANFGGKNTVIVDNPKGEFTWKIPIKQDLPYIVEDVESDNKNLGANEVPFKIKINRRAFGHSEIITYDKMSGLEMIVTEDDILPALDGYIYTVRLINNSTTTAIDQSKYLTPGTKIFSMGTAKTGYSEKYADLGQLTNGYREYYNFVGQAKANIHYSVSRMADLIAQKGINADGTVSVTEIWRNFDTNVDPSISDIFDLQNKMGKDYIKKSMQKGTLTKTFLTKLEATHLSKIAKDIENQLMWGKGGRVPSDGVDDIRLSVGLWKQLDYGTKRIYNRSTFSLDLFRTEIFNYYNGKEVFDGPDSKRSIIVQTGLAGFKLVNNAIMAESNNAGFALGKVELGPNGIGAISGSNMDLNFGYAFTSYQIPFLANVKFVINPALDTTHNNDIENPIIDGFPLSSYSFLVFDVTDNTNDNIFLLKNKYDSELSWRYVNGTMDYLGRSSGFQSSGNFNGYKVYMEQAYPGIWVKDPTKVLKIVMRNPVTGYSM